MVFSSLTFLFFFLPIVLALYYVSPKKLQNGTLLIVSLIFYAWGEPVYVCLIIFSALSDYVHGLIISKHLIKAKWKAKLALVSSIVINIGLLSFFKYADFLIENVNTVLQTNFELLDLPLPIGISFYTFQTISYIIDVYRGEVSAQRNPVTLMMYVSLFPQLIAGPIVRYQAIEQSLNRRRWNTDQFAEGVQLFIIGLGKKVLIANNIGLLYDQIQSQPVSELTVVAAWLGMIAFGFQIYFDFSGYSDMAIGLGKMFGFEFPMNFNYPYVSKSVSEFWRRWHISLGAWFRDYVYIPLGGSRVGKWKLYRNLFIVWGLTGLWHGASWNFILWGLYFGTLIMLERAGLKNVLVKLPTVIPHMYLLFVIVISWVFFVHEDLSSIAEYFQAMFNFSGTWVDDFTIYLLYTNAILIIVTSILSTPVLKVVHHRSFEFIKVMCYIIILFLVTAYLVDESFNPFLYFRF
ncbi:MBOAT family O-acyltransferase [Bacillaceae bacterium W0354]